MKNTRYQSLLRKAMGTDSQAEFARKTGLSRVSINRMLHHPKNAGIPSVTTLRKISSVSPDVSFVELADACGYDTNVLDIDDFIDIQAEHDRRVNNLSEEERVEAFKLDLMNYAKEYLSWNRGHLIDIDQLPSMFIDMYSVEDVYGFVRKQNIPCQGDGNIEFGDYVAVIEFEAKINSCIYTVPMVVSYYETTHNNVIIANILFDGNHVRYFDEKYNNPEYENVSIICIKNELKKINKDMSGRVKTRKDSNYLYPTTTVGFGFDVTDVELTEEMISWFYEDYCDDILAVINDKSVNKKNLYEKIPRDHDGFFNLVANVIKRKSWQKFFVYMKEPSEIKSSLTDKCRSYVMYIPSDIETEFLFNSLSLEEQEKIAKICAIFGINEFGPCYFRDLVDVREISYTVPTYIFKIHDGYAEDIKEIC